MSNTAENSDPEAYYRSFPLELQLEPPDVSIARLAIKLVQEDPRIMPALGKLASTTQNDPRSKQEAVVAAFLLGRQYEQSKGLDAQYQNSPDEMTATDTHNDGNEVLPPAA